MVWNEETGWVKRSSVGVRKKERRMDFEATRLRRHPQCTPTLGKRDIFGFLKFFVRS